MKAKSIAKKRGHIDPQVFNRALGDLWIQANLMVQVCESQRLTNPEWESPAASFLGALAVGVRDELSKVNQELRSAVPR